LLNYGRNKFYNIGPRKQNEELNDSLKSAEAEIRRSAETFNAEIGDKTAAVEKLASQLAEAGTTATLLLFLCNLCLDPKS
jgi:hypothetical protein